MGKPVGKWANGLQKSRLVNFVLESRLPFAQSVPFTVKRTRRPDTGINMALKKHSFPFVTFRPEEQDFLVRCSLALRNNDVDCDNKEWNSAESRPWDGGGSGHPDLKMRGPQFGLRIIGGGPPGPLPWIHYREMVCTWRVRIINANLLSFLLFCRCTARRRISC